MGEPATAEFPIPKRRDIAQPPPLPGPSETRELAATKSVEETAQKTTSEKKYDSLTNPNETVAEKITRLGVEGSRHFYSGVVQIAVGITQVSLAQQEKAENGTSEENQTVLNTGLQNIGEGTAKVDTARDVVNHANGIAQHENKRASLGSSGPMPTRTLAFERENAGSEANEKLKEMEDVSGVPATTLINAMNHGARREEVISLAGGAKGVHLSESEVASIPQFSFSTSASAEGPSAPTATGGINFTGALRGLDASIGARKPAAIAFAAAEKKSSSEIAVARASGNEEPLHSLGAENLLSSISGKVSAPTGEGSLFQRVRQQYNKRFADLAAKDAAGKTSSAR